jgi:hypothetical protein
MNMPGDDQKIQGTVIIHLYILQEPIGQSNMLLRFLVYLLSVDCTMQCLSGQI